VLFAVSGFGSGLGGRRGVEGPVITSKSKLVRGMGKLLGLQTRIRTIFRGFRNVLDENTKAAWMGRLLGLAIAARS
jgi:hypothetical protein